MAECSVGFCSGARADLHPAVLTPGGHKAEFSPGFPTPFIYWMKSLYTEGAAESQGRGCGRTKGPGPLLTPNLSGKRNTWVPHASFTSCGVAGGYGQGAKACRGQTEVPVPLAIQEMGLGPGPASLSGQAGGTVPRLSSGPQASASI